MRMHAKLGFIASILGAVLVLPAPPAEAGGSFSMHVGSGGFGVSVGVGDWGPYTSSWTNSRYSLDFNATLSGYGEWVWVGNLGRVWKPWVAVGWQPYTHGRWVLTTLGWTWVAYEPWGYVPHHYGSWAMCDFGWVWVPGYTYVSANVVWVRSSGYVGWYARPPRGWSHAARSYRSGYRNGYRDGWNDARYATYVDWHHVASDNVSHYAVEHAVASHGRVEDHATAPTVEEVRRRGGISVPEAQLSQRSATMNGRRVTIARPEGLARDIERHASATAAAALSPRALERRQPAIRPASSAARSPSRAQDPPRTGSFDRRQPATGTSVSTRFSEPIGSGDDADGEAARRATSHGNPTGSHLRQHPETIQSTGSSRQARPSTTSAPGGRRATQTSVAPRRITISKPSASNGTSSPSSRRVTRAPARSGSVADRSGARRGSAVVPPPNRPSASAPLSRSNTSHTARDARRKPAPHSDKQTDKAPKRSSESRRIKKR